MPLIVAQTAYFTTQLVSCPAGPGRLNAAWKRGLLSDLAGSKALEPMARRSEGAVSDPRDAKDGRRSWSLQKGAGQAEMHRKRRAFSYNRPVSRNAQRGRTESRMLLSWDHHTSARRPAPVAAVRYCGTRDRP